MCNRKINDPKGALWMELRDPELLARLMDLKGFSQRSLAREIGWKSHTHLHRMLRGEKKTLSHTSALLIAHALGVMPDQIFLTRVARKTCQSQQKDRRKAAA